MINGINYCDIITHHLDTFSSSVKVLNDNGLMDRCLPHLHREFARYYLDHEKYEQAANIFKALINSKHTISQDYIAYRQYESNYNPETKGKVTDTLIRAMER